MIRQFAMLSNDGVISRLWRFASRSIPASMPAGGSSSRAARSSSRSIRRRASRSRAWLAASQASYEQAVESAAAAFKKWRLVPPPQRGEVVRQIGNALRERKSDLGMLVTLEAGKIKSEGLGEVQEMIDMCDFAVGLSRQLYGLTIASERAEPPDVRAVASARARRLHHGVQFSGRRLGLERGAGAGLRRSGRLEAVGADAADRRRRAAHRQSRAGAGRAWRAC